MNRQFPALRGAAILLVVLYHVIDMGTLGPQGLGYPAPEGWERDILLVLQQLGMFAVPTFLFISGCFAAYAARGDPPKMSCKAVWAGLNRILWPYVFWSIAFYIVMYLVRGETDTLLGYAKKLAVGYPFHFIPLLVFYYLLSPLLARLAKRFGHLLIVVIAVYQLVLMNLTFPGILGFAFPNRMELIVPPVLGHTLAEWGIYFPLGLIYGLNVKSMKPQLRKLKWMLVGTTLVSLLLSMLHAVSVLRFPLAGYICPLAFVLFSPLIKRDSIPMVRRLEGIGKKSYGLYLTHLIVLEFVFLGIRVSAPWLLSHQALLSSFLFVFALGVPLLTMNSAARLPVRTVYRYVFG